MAGQEFEIPLKLADLEEGGGPFAVKELDERATSAPQELAKTISQELGFKEVVDIEQEEIFVPVYSLVRNFSKLPATAKVLLADTLCTNLLLLNPSIHSLVTSTKDSTEDGAAEGYASLLQSHRNALKIYVLFLHEICAAEEKEAPAAAAEKAATAPPGTRRRAPSKKNAASSWDWDFQRPRVIRPLAGALEADLKELYRMDQPEEPLLNLFTRTAFLMLDNPAVPRDRDADLKADVYKILALCCAKYGHTLPVTTALIHSLLKFEHSPGPLAEVAALVATKHDDAQLAVGALREIGRMDPRELLRDAPGAKNVGAFLVELAERLPKVVARNFSVVMGHMNGEQYHIRSALVTVLGRIVAKAFDEKEDNSAAEQARLKSKQALLDVLLERVRDVNSFTRTRVLQTWAYLCEENQVHLGLFNRVTEIATGRLEDKASNVRKAALQLLSTLIVCNPFASDLRVAPYESTLKTFQEKLDKAEAENRPSDEELLAAAFGPESGGLRTERSGEAEQSREGEDGGERPLASEDTGNEGTRTGSPVESNDQQEPEANSQPTQPEPESNSQSTQPEATAQSDQNGASLTRLRAMVASLDAAVRFTKQLAKTMPVFDKLLASASVTDVTETIQFLELAKSRKCEDVDDRLRLMLPLIFSREVSVKDAVSAACEKLYVKVSEEGTGQRGLADPKLAAKNLVGLAVGGSLGTLASLEAIVVVFMQRELVTHGMVRALWDIFEGRGEAITPAHSRGALAVLTMAAKGNPDVITSKLDSLLRNGLGPRAQKDPLLARYTCVALQRISLGGEKGKLEAGHAAFGALTWVMTKALLPDESWFPAAEQAVGALYALHPTPEAVCAGLVRDMAGGLFGQRTDPPEKSGADVERPGENESGNETEEGSAVSEGEKDADGPAEAPEGASEASEAEAEERIPPSEGAKENESSPGVTAPPGAAPPAENAANGADSHPTATSFGCSIGALSRFLFVVGHVALKHLVYVESCARDVRRMRVSRDKDAAQAAADRRDAELAGVAVTQQTQESAEETDKINEELGVGSASADAHLDSLTEAAEREILSPQGLVGHVAPVVARICRSSALLQEHPLLRAAALLALCKLMAVDAGFCEANLQLLFTLVRNAPEEAVRCNCVIALGDLAFRFPNLVEPWTEHVYARLRDDSVLVRKNTVMVLTHLILNDMMKVKGHISEMALCLEDEDERIRDLTKLFFHELSKKGNNPIYNLLPDMLSRLSSDARVPPAAFRGILEYMLGFIEKDKQTEGLIEKLCNRFLQTTELKQWRDIAYCLAQLRFTERGLKKLVDHFKSYQDTLFDDEVVEHFRAIITKAKKFAKPEMKAAVDEFEKQLTATHLEKKEDWAVAQKAARRAAGAGVGATPAGESTEEGEAAENNADLETAEGEVATPKEGPSADVPEADGSSDERTDGPMNDGSDGPETPAETAAPKPEKVRCKAAGNGKRAAKGVVSESEESEIEEESEEEEENERRMAVESPAEAGAEQRKGREKAIRKGEAATGEMAVETEDEESGRESESEEDSTPKAKKAGARGTAGMSSKGKGGGGRESVGHATREDGEGSEGEEEMIDAEEKLAEEDGSHASEDEKEIAEDSEAESEDSEGDQAQRSRGKAVASSTMRRVSNSSGIEKPVKGETGRRASVNRRSGAGVNRHPVKREPEEEEGEETGDENTSPPKVGKGTRGIGSMGAKAGAPQPPSNP